jgi:exopolysaccharide production protein ExoQ
MNQLLLLSEKIFAVTAFIHYSGGPILVLISDAISEGEEVDPIPSFAIINQIFLIIYFVTFCLLILRWKKVLPVILNSGLVWLLFGLAISSILWSYSPDLTRTRITALMGTMMFSLYLASRYSLKEQLQLFAWIFGTIIVLSIIFAVLLPRYGQMGGVHLGAWRGIYNHKNVLGKIMVPSAIVFLLSALTAQKQRWIYWSFLGATVMLIVLSKASSPIVSLFVLLALLAVLPILRWNYLLMVPLLIGITSVGIVIYLLLTANAEQAAGIFGKDLTLTGRTNFWPLLLDKIREKPWLGYGFGAFWQGLDGPSAYVWNASAFKAPNGHNGYLDLCLELGLVGFAVYGINFVNSVRKALVHIKLTSTADRFWPLLLLCYVILCNSTESSLVLQNNFLWTMQLAIFFSLAIPQSSKVDVPGFLQKRSP